MNFNDLVTWTLEGRRKNKLDNVNVTEEDKQNSILLIDAVLNGRNPYLSTFSLKTYPFCVVFIKVVTHFRDINEPLTQITLNNFLKLLQETHWQLDEEEIPMYCLKFKKMIRNAAKQLQEKNNGY